MGVHRFTELRAWQACDVYKKAVYRLCSTGRLSTDLTRRLQLERAAAGAPAHVAEGFGRFNPADFARFLTLNFELRTEPEHEPRTENSEV
ncbi:MAG: four helix bundle protein [Acidobacteria bacterium]|nr:four helix bundle protein [Acidobacteriota bacterium]